MTSWNSGVAFLKYDFMAGNTGKSICVLESFQLLIGGALVCRSFPFAANLSQYFSYRDCVFI